MPMTALREHESLKIKIQKRKKARPNTPLSCKIQYYIKDHFCLFLRPIRFLHGRLFTDRQKREEDQSDGSEPIECPVAVMMSYRTA